MSQSSTKNERISILEKKNKSLKRFLIGTTLFSVLSLIAILIFFTNEISSVRNQVYGNSYGNHSELKVLEVLSNKNQKDIEKLNSSFDKLEKELDRTFIQIENSFNTLDKKKKNKLF